MISLHVTGNMSTHQGLHEYSLSTRKGFMNIRCCTSRVHEYSLVPRGDTDLERVYGHVRPWRPPFSRLSCSSQGSHFKQKSQFTRTLLRKFGNCSLYSLNFRPIGQILAHKPPNMEIFSSQALFSEANISSQALHFGNPGRTPLPEKKKEKKTLSAPRD